MTISYATVDQIWDEQTPVSKSAVTTVQNQKALEYGQAVAGKFDEQRGFSFAPTIDTEYRNVVETIERGRIKGALLYLDTPLLSATTVTLGDTTELTEGTDFRLHPRGKTPAEALRMINTAISWTDRIDKTSDLSILGEWGWRPDYANAWVDSNDSVQGASLTTTQLTVTVTDADGKDTQGLIPRFSPGNMIRIDSEFMSVVSIASEVLTVVRGIRGSTAATHANDAQIDVFKPDIAVVRAARRQAAFDLARTGKFTRVTFDGVNITVAPDIIPEVQKIIEKTAFLVLGGV